MTSPLAISGITSLVQLAVGAVSHLIEGDDPPPVTAQASTSQQPSDSQTTETETTDPPASSASPAIGNIIQALAMALFSGAGGPGGSLLDSGAAGQLLNVRG